jgi:hypothetical protein
MPSDLKSTRRRQLKQLKRLPRKTVGEFARAVNVPIKPTDTKPSLARRILASKKGKALTATGAILTLFALGMGGRYVLVKTAAEDKQVTRIVQTAAEICSKYSTFKSFWIKTAAGEFKKAYFINYNFKKNLIKLKLCKGFHLYRKCEDLQLQNRQGELNHKKKDSS